MNAHTLPALIDCHVHFREPGLTQKATMASEARAARAGGVRTVCEMPNTIPPTVTMAALADKVRRAEEVADDCDLRFFFGVTAAEHLMALRTLWTDEAAEVRRLKERCCGVKLYLDHSTGDQKVDADIVDDVFMLCAEHGIPLVAHCEDPATNAAAAAQISGAHPGMCDVGMHSLMRPVVAEERSIAFAIEKVRRHGTPFHVAHLSTAQGIALVRSAKEECLPVTCEVAPHHLFLSTDDYDTLGALGKMNPPLRTPEHRAALWAGIADGTVDCIATDHAPHTREEKACDNPLDAPSGVPGVETMLPLLLSVAAGHWPHPVAKRPPLATLSIDQIVRLCHERPNAIYALGKEDDPQRIVVDRDREWTIRAADMRTACGWTPYEGWRVRGRVID